MRLNSMQAGLATEGQARQASKLIGLVFFAVVAFSLICPGNSALAQGFPGKGEPGAWSDALPHYNLGNRYLEHERLDEAIEQYETAISLYQYDPDFYINLGYALRKIKDYAGAEKAFRKALSLNDKDWLSWSNLANSLLKQDRLPETIAAFEKCLKCAPPAKEKEAILKDIADIKKVLSFRNSPPPASKPAAVIRKTVKAAPGKGSSGSGSSASKSGSGAVDKGGWEYVN